MKVALDVDGVIADFYLGACRITGNKYEMIDRWEIEWMIDFATSQCNTEEFWENLPVLNPPESITFDFDCYITHIPEEMKEARRRWLIKNGFPDKPIYCTGDKITLMKELGIQVLIDDRPSTVAEANRSGILGIRFIPAYYSEPVNSFHHIKHLSDAIRVINNEKRLRNMKFLAKEKK